MNDKRFFLSSLDIIKYTPQTEARQPSLCPWQSWFEPLVLCHITDRKLQAASAGRRLLTVLLWTLFHGVWVYGPPGDGLSDYNAKNSWVSQRELFACIFWIRRMLEASRISQFLPVWLPGAREQK
jgi:hypothetical protein